MVMDFLTRSERSKRMSQIRKRDTVPELVVRHIAHMLGYRFRLHDRRLPGTPDLVFPRLGKIVDIRGCFWHSHNCRRGRPPVASRTDYWHPKLKRIIQRDKRTGKELRALGWDILVIWECETKNVLQLERRLKRFLTRSLEI